MVSPDFPSLINQPRGPQLEYYNPPHPPLRVILNASLHASPIGFSKQMRLNWLVWHP